MLPNGHRVIFVFIVNAHQRAASAEKDLSDQVDRTLPLDFTLFPYPPLSLPSELMKKTLWWQAWRLCIYSETWVSTHQTNLATATAE